MHGCEQLPGGRRPRLPQGATRHVATRCSNAKVCARRSHEPPERSAGDVTCHASQARRRRVPSPRLQRRTSCASAAPRWRRAPAVASGRATRRVPRELCVLRAEARRSRAPPPDAQPWCRSHSSGCLHARGHQAPRPAASTRAASSGATARVSRIAGLSRRQPLAADDPPASPGHEQAPRPRPRLQLGHPAAQPRPRQQEAARRDSPDLMTSCNREPIESVDFLAFFCTIFEAVRCATCANGEGVRVPTAWDGDRGEGRCRPRERRPHAGWRGTASREGPASAAPGEPRRAGNRPA